MTVLETEEAVVQAIRSAKGPLAIKGGGTRIVGRPHFGHTLDISGLAGVTLYEPGALTLVAKAGTPVSEIEATLAKQNQRLAFEPYDLTRVLGTSGTTTIGGVMATNASGPRRISAGAARDFALGVRFVDGAGRVIKNGGRVMKNVTGYDLVKLMCGSWGTLGVLTEVSLKVLPAVEAETTLCIDQLDADTATAAMSRALGSPFDVSAAAWSGGRVWLRLEGFAASVAYRVQELQAVLSPFGSAEERHVDWSTVRDASDFADCTSVWRISVKPSDGPKVISAAPDGCQSMLDWGGGLVWIGQSNGDIAATHTLLQTTVAQLGGHATLIKGPDAVRAAVPVFQPETQGVATLTSALRHRFDPQGILNPGLLAA